MRPKTISDEEILEVVRTCVLNEGPAVSTQIIAEQVGVSQATLFKRFGNKVHLISRALLLGVQAPNLIRSLEADVDRDKPEKQLFEMATNQAFFEKMVPCWSAPLRGSNLPRAFRKKYRPPNTSGFGKLIRTLQHEGIARDTEHPETVANNDWCAPNPKLSTHYPRHLHDPKRRRIRERPGVSYLACAFKKGGVMKTPYTQFTTAGALRWLDNGCIHSPDLAPQPLQNLPTHYTEPSDSTVKGDRWWLAFEDHDLNTLAEQALVDNQQLLSTWSDSHKPRP